MKHISLFSGIGGFDLAAQWVGWDNLASCEINPFGRRVLSYYWPEAYHHDDIKTLTGEIIEHEAQKRYGSDWRADGVILSGGFPCQPYSLAGKRLGKEDERHLWPEMLRVIQEVKPTWIVGENVFGLVNWSDGLVFDEVQIDLEAQGYEVQAYLLPACAADAPHRRDRVWIVAYADSIGRDNWSDNRKERQFPHNQERIAPESESERGRRLGGAGQICGDGVTANTNGIGQPGEKHEHQESGFSCENSKGISWHDFPTEPPVRAGDDGISAGLDGITFPKWRNESIKAAGNAIVPQIAFRIFETINSFTQHNTHGTQFEQTSL